MNRCFAPSVAILPRIAFFVAMIFLTLTALGCGNRGEIEVLECTGSCTCDEETRSCRCAGGTTCAIEGAEDITFYCDGNAACDLTCGVGCHVICPGTTGCTVNLGHTGTAECQGTAQCNYFCEGECSVSCGGAAQCTVECADGCTRDGLGCRC